MSKSDTLKKRRLTILAISSIPMWTLGHKGGMPSIYWGQRGFVLSGHAVHFLAPGEQRGEEVTEDGVHLHYFKVPFKPISAKHLTAHRISVKLYGLLFLFCASRAGLRIAKQVKPDVVYGHALGAVPAWFVARRRRIKNVTRLYGTFLLPNLSSTIGLLKKCEEVLAFKIPSSFLIVTEDGTGGAEVARRLGVPVERVRLWRNGVNRFYDPNFDVDEFKKSIGISPADRIVLAASRLAEWKRVDRIVSAVPEVVSELKDVVFLILGEGPERQRLEGLCETLGIKNHVRLVGAVPQTEVGKYINAADLFVSLFDLSNVSNAVQEAMACGKCVVALDVGDTSKLIEQGQTGILVDPNEIERLPAIIKGALTDTTMRTRLGESAKRFADEQMPSWEQRAQMEVDLVENLVEGNQAGALKS